MDAFALRGAPMSALLGQLTAAWSQWPEIVLLSLRISAIFLLTPVLYAMPLPGILRALLVMGLSIVLAAALTGNVAWHASDFFSAAMAELALGATLGLGILLSFAAFSIAGQLLDVQLGFGIAQVFDPVTQRTVPMLTSAFQYAAAVVFFLVDGHHALIRGIAYSIEYFPIGQPWGIEMAAAPIMRLASEMFSLGFALAAPVAFCILLVEFGLGVIARNLPQMNMFALGIPVKILVGLIALSFWFTDIGGAMNRVYERITVTWEAIFAATPHAVGAGSK